jgi:hypothetical protein
MSGLGTLYGGVLDLLSHPPPSSELTPSIAGVDELGEPFEQASLGVLTKKLTKLQAAQPLPEIFEILYRSKGIEGETVEVDMAHLSESELKALWDLVRKKEAAQNLKLD